MTPTEPTLTDHEVEADWPTASYSDFCKTCGWPVSRKDPADQWGHEAKNQMHWIDRRLEARLIEPVPTGSGGA